MEPKKKEHLERCLLKFRKKYDNLEDLRSEISSCLITEDNLWLSYDEDAGIERLTRKKKKYKYKKHKHYQLSDFFDLPADNEADMEALAYEEPYLWFCGSMSMKRNSPDENDDLETQLKALTEIAIDENRFSLGRIPCLKDGNNYKLVKEAKYKGETIKAEMMRGGTKSTELHNALMRDEHLKDFMAIPCKDNGFDIEGLAVFEGRIFIGLRGPVLNGYAVILEIMVDCLNDELIMQKHEGEDNLYRKHFLDLAGMGIRELNITKNGDLFILAGPTMDLDGTISIYKVKGGLPDQSGSVTFKPDRLFDVARGSEITHGKDKAEGMAFISNNEILITYDSPVEDRLKGKNKVEMDVYEF